MIIRSWKEKISIALQERYRTSYSICGEDCILAYLFQRYETGFYVDVGAYDPVVFSNTHRFYLQGWQGINIEMNADALPKFRQYRPRDITVHAAVSEKEQMMEYFQVSGSPTMNTLSEDFVREQAVTQVTSTRRVQARRLDAVLSEHLPDGRSIHFLSVDVEGHEPEVLRSNDWQRFRPKVIVLESYEPWEADKADAEIRAFLRGQRYHLRWKTPNGIYFVDEDVSLTANNRIKV